MLDDYWRRNTDLRLIHISFDFLFKLIAPVHCECWLSSYLPSFPPSIRRFDAQEENRFVNSCPYSIFDALSVQFNWCCCHGFVVELFSFPSSLLFKIVFLFDNQLHSYLGILWASDCLEVNRLFQACFFSNQTLLHKIPTLRLPFERSWQNYCTRRPR